MPTGVAVSPAMHHGGPYPSTGHAGFTSVGIPASIRRFVQLQCYDGIKDSRLPDVLKNANPLKIWRYVDGNWAKDGIVS
jgi:NADP-dependent aldehyde dehydrogenase